MKRGGVNCVLEMLFLCAITVRDREYELAVTYIASVLYMICYGHCQHSHPRHVFLHSVLEMMDKHQHEMTLMATIGPNVLVNAIWLQCSTNNALKRVDFVDALPRNVVSVYTVPLICGYIRSECRSAPNIPDDILNSIAFFF